MYKNFSLTDKERQEILESHMSHGYKKPLNEDMSPENEKFFTKQRQSAMDHMKNAGPETLYKEKLISKLNSLVNHIEDEIENLMGDGFEESSNQMSFEVMDEVAKMIISKLDEIKNNVRAEYLEKEPSDDDIYNQPGYEGGIKY